MNKISVKYLKKTKNSNTKWFEYYFGTEEYTIEELLSYIKGNQSLFGPSEITFLLANFKFTQTQQMIDYYISLNPSYRDLSLLLFNCEYAKNNEKLLKYIKKLLERKKL